VRRSGARVHFVDDRLETLRAVSQSPGLRHVQLYLAAWCARAGAEGPAPGSPSL